MHPRKFILQNFFMHKPQQCTSGQKHNTYNNLCPDTGSILGQWDTDCRYMLASLAEDWVGQSYKLSLYKTHCILCLQSLSQVPKPDLQVGLLLSVCSKLSQIRALFYYKMVARQGKQCGSHPLEVLNF